jgi:hypothetical protein
MAALYASRLLLRDFSNAEKYNERFRFMAQDLPLSQYITTRQTFDQMANTEEEKQSRCVSIVLVLQPRDPNLASGHDSC